MSINPETPNAYERLLDWLAGAAIIIAGACLVTLVSTFGWLVFGRYVLNQTPTWVEQLSLLLVTTITFLAAAVGVHERSHLSVDILSGWLPVKGKQLLGLFNDSVLFAFGCALFIYGWDLMEFAWRKNIPLLGIPEGVRYIPMVISGALIVLFEVARIHRGGCGFINSFQVKTKVTKQASIEEAK
ncbi:MAG: TRAP transporter small permease [Pontibacterium sp.]